MALETGSFLDDLTITNPLGADAKNEGDDHIRLVKKVLKATFPGMAGAAWRVQTKTGTYTVAASDNMTTINCTTALTLNLTAAATLGNQHMFLVVANGGAVTIDPDGAETINGSATLAVVDGASAFVICSGTLFLAAIAAGDVTTTTPLPRSYGAGCVPSHDTDATNDINVTAGAWRNATNDGNLVLSSEETKRIDASWATGNDAGGLSSSLTLTNDTWYHIFLILVAGVVEVGFDTSVVAANLIADHSATKYRRVGSVLRATATNLAFSAREVAGGGLEVYWDVAVQDGSSIYSTTAADLGLTVPTGIQVEAILQTWVNDANGINARVYPTSATDETVTAANATLRTAAGAAAPLSVASPRVATDTSGNVRVRADGTPSSSDSVLTLGWVDSRR